MKLIYFTSISYPSGTANSKQIFAMTTIFKEKLGENFTFILNKKDDTLSHLDPIEIGCRWKRFKTIFILWWTIFHLKKEKGTIIYCRDANICLILILLKPFFRFKICFELHHLMLSYFKVIIIGNFADIVICINSILRSKIISLVGILRQGHIFVESSAVDLKIFDISISKSEARKILGLSQDKKIVGYTGRFSTLGKKKSIEDVLLAIKAIDSQDIEFVAVGEKEVDNIIYHQNLSKNLGIESKTFFYHQLNKVD